MVMVWLEGGQGEARGACAPPPSPPPPSPPQISPPGPPPPQPTLPEPPPLPMPPPPPPPPPPPGGPSAHFYWGGEVAYRSEETSPPWERTSEVALGAVRQAVGGGCQRGSGLLLSVTNAIEPGTCCQGDSGWP